MSNQHPITPPPELMKQWQHEADFQFKPTYKYVAARAAQWGADQELEACCEWLENQPQWMEDLRTARRPKPPSLAEQALEALDYSLEYDVSSKYELIRRALERLQELENNQ